jgi:hypothetical protein
MNLKEIINKGRAYRSLEPAQITEELVRDLTESAQLHHPVPITGPGVLYM